MSQENETRLVEVVNPLCRDISSIQTRCLDHMSWWSLMAFYESGMSILAASNSLFARATVSRIASNVRKNRYARVHGALKRSI